MKTPSHILVIRLSALGDVAMTIPVLRTLRATYPGLEITALSKPNMAPLFSEVENCNFLAADVYGEHKGLGLLKLAGLSKEQGIDAVADLHNVLRSKAITTYLSIQRIPSARIDKGRAEKKTLIKSSKKLKRLKSTHQRYAEVFESLGFTLDLTSYSPPAKKQLTSRLHEVIGKHTKKMIGIAPFAAYKSKMYPLPMMYDVLNHLNEDNTFKIVLFGGGTREIETLQKWASKFENVTNIAGQFSFEDELKLISNLDLMVSMDSANGHLAAMYGVSVLTLWGVTHPYAGFTPFQQPNENQLISNRDEYPHIPTSVYGNTFPAGYEEVMRSIPVEVVLEKIKELA